MAHVPTFVRFTIVTYEALILKVFTYLLRDGGEHRERERGRGESFSYRVFHERSRMFEIPHTSHLRSKLLSLTGRSPDPAFAAASSN